MRKRLLEELCEGQRMTIARLEEDVVRLRNELDEARTSPILKLAEQMAVNEMELQKQQQAMFGFTAEGVDRGEQSEDIT